MLEGVPAVDDQLVEGKGLLGDGHVDHRPQLLGLDKEKTASNVDPHFCFNAHKNQISLTAHFTLHQFWLKSEDLHSTFWRLKKIAQGESLL